MSFPSQTTSPSSARASAGVFPAPFQANERWAAVGDSITHGGFYHHYIHLYYATRFPERRMDLFNCGISGNAAANVLRRLDDDVLIHRPTVATLLLGMNDAVGPLYAAGKSGPQVEAERAKALETYGTNMRTLIERIQEAGVRVIVITPTIYDDTLVHPAATIADIGFSGAVDRCAEIVSAAASEFGAAVIDIHRPLAEWNAQQQKTNSAYTLVGLDRVHLGEVGHFVIAYEFLRAQGAPAFVSRIVVDAPSGQTRDLIGAQVDQIKPGTHSLEFDCLESALPFPVPAACQPALEFLPFIDELNRQILKVERLTAGTYELRIDGNLINSYSAENLGEGINLAIEPATPQHQQAQAVLEVAARRTEAYGVHLRGIAEIEWGSLLESGVDPNDMTAIKQFLDERVEKDKEQPWYEYCKEQVAAYPENKRREKEDRVQVAEFAEEIYKRNAPVYHHYSIRAAATP